MLEEKDLNSEQRVRMECIDLATRVSEVGTPPIILVQRAEELEEYIRSGDKSSPIEGLTHDENTLRKVRDVIASEVDPNSADNIIADLLNRGFFFRERANG